MELENFEENAAKHTLYMGILANTFIACQCMLSKMRKVQLHSCSAGLKLHMHTITMAKRLRAVKLLVAISTFLQSLQLDGLHARVHNFDAQYCLSPLDDLLQTP